MAYAIIPKPGSDYLCATACVHEDCADLRKLAADACGVCKKPIGYGVKWAVFGKFPAHYICVLEATNG